MKNKELLKKMALVLFVSGLIGFYFYREKKINHGRYTASTPPESVITKLDFKFEEIGTKIGLNHKHRLYIVNPVLSGYKAVRPVNASVSVADVNNDGYMDLYFTVSRQGELNRLYLGTKEGIFRDATVEYGLDVDKNDPGVSIASAFMDYDNDGYPDLVVTRAGCSSLYKNIQGKKFVDVSAETGLDKVCIHSSGISVLDYDKDGYLDLYISGNYTVDPVHDTYKDLTYYPRLSKWARYRGGKNYLLKNIKGHKFEIQKKALGADNGFYAWSSGVTDVNGDSWPDIIVANDANITRVYMNHEGKYFTEETKNIMPVEWQTFNMGVETGDIDNDGKMEFFVPNVSMSTYFPGGKNFLFKLNDEMKYEQISTQKNVDRCGWAWGSKFFDINKDGYLDLFVSNGYFGDGPKNYAYKFVSYNMLPPFIIRSGRDFPTTEGHQLENGQKNCFYLNDHGKSFENVAEQVGITDEFNGRGVAVIDYNNDGNLDVVVANHNERPVFYKSTVSNNNNWIGFRLQGTISNRDGVGATVRIFDGKTHQMRENYPANSFASQSDPRLYFGLGQSTDINIEITWPSGIIQKVKNYKINSYNLILEEREAM